MAQKLNTEFNYRTQVEGQTVWERIKTLNGFYIGRKRARDLEKINALRLDAKREKIKWLREGNGPIHEAMELEAEVMEIESSLDDAYNCYRLNEDELEILERLLSEAHELAEPTRIPGYTDEQMFEANAVNEFTAMIGKEIYAEIIANGRPSAAKVRNAMSSPQTWLALQEIGLIPKDSPLMLVADDPKDKLLYFPT